MKTKQKHLKLMLKKGSFRLVVRNNLLTLRVV